MTNLTENWKHLLLKKLKKSIVYFQLDSLFLQLIDVQGK